MYAIRESKFYVIPYLLKYPSAIESINNGFTALHELMLNPHESTLQLLLNHKTPVNNIGMDGTTPLWILCTNAKNRNKTILQMLLENGANVNNKVNNSVAIINYLE